jgi:hypothetical protein
MPLAYGNCDDYLQYIPNKDFNYQNTPTLTIRVSFHFLRDSLGGGIYQNDQTANVTETMQWLNGFYDNIYTPVLPTTPPAEEIDDSRIQFVESGIFYHNSAMWYESDVRCGSEYRDIFGTDTDKIINIFFYTSNTWSGGCGPQSYVNMMNYTHSWAGVQLIAHELGHVIGLPHTFDGCNDDSFDDTFHPDLNMSWLHCGQDVSYTVNCTPQNYTGISNNIMGYNMCRSYLSPKQMGRVHYFNITNSQKRRYIRSEYYSNEPNIVINNNSIWYSSKVINSDLIIEPYKEMIIKCSVYLSPHSKIVVKPNGRLIIDGGELISLTNVPWQGIEVWGNSSAHQYPDANGNYQQGYLELKNGATIENALTAVALWKPNDWTKTGGIVVAEDAVFRNNTRAVHAPEYRNYVPGNPLTEIDNRSNFKNCTFEITSEYLGEATFYKHIDLSKVKGIKFAGCDFSLSPDASGISEWNQAIASYNAGFSVDAILTYQQTGPTYDSCTFSGFYSGIYASRSESSTKTFFVNRASFTNNTYGVKTFNIYSLAVINSNFKIGYNNSTEALICAGVPAYGIYLDNSSGFAIEENHFTKVANAPSANYYGVFAKNTHSQDIIYKNYFTGLSCGNYAEAINYGYYAYSGLKYYCNSNENNYTDFYVQKGDPSGVQSGQGSTTISAGNTFSNNATWHFYNDGNNLIDYYYVYNCSACNPDVNKLYRVTKHAIYQSNACPSHYGGGNEEEFILSAEQKAEREVLFADALTNYNGVKTLYENLKDGGSTASALTEIQMAQPQNMWDLRSKLLGDSPHLSEDVLKELADKTDVFTEAAIFDILAANPDELKKEDLIKYLEDKENPLPEYMIEILRQVATGTTYKSVLQQEMAKYEQIKSLAANDMIRSILNDSITDFVQLRNWFDNRGGIESDKSIIASYAEEGNYTATFSLANALPSLYNLQDKELQEHINYMQLLDLERILAIENRKITGLNTTEQASLNSIADSSDNASGATSKGILETYYGSHFCNCPEIVGETAFKSSYVNPNDVNKIYGIEINVKPNPAKDWAAFDYTLPENAKNATFIITDAFGKTIANFVLSGIQGQQLWDTRSIVAGTYLYILKVNGSSKTGKIVINK